MRQVTEYNYDIADSFRNLAGYAGEDGGFARLLVPIDLPVMIGQLTRPKNLSRAKPDFGNVNMPLRGSVNGDLIGSPLYYKGAGVTPKSNITGELSSLEGSPIVISGCFSIFAEYDIPSLIGGPIYVDGDYTCTDSGITSLEGIAVYIGGDLRINDTMMDDGFEDSNNRDPKSIMDHPMFEHMPAYIGGQLVLNMYILKKIIKHFTPDHVKRGTPEYPWDEDDVLPVFRKYLYENCGCVLKGGMQSFEDYY